MTQKQKTRARFRKAVFTRDGYRCTACRRPVYDRQEPETNGPGLAPADAHHLTDRSAGEKYDPADAVTLCDDCHKKAEAAKWG